MNMVMIDYENQGNPHWTLR